MRIRFYLGAIFGLVMGTLVQSWWYVLAISILACIFITLEMEIPKFASTRTDD